MGVLQKIRKRWKEQVPDPLLQDAKRLCIHFQAINVADQLDPYSRDDTRPHCQCKPSNIPTRSPSYSRLPPHVNIAEAASLPRVDGCQPSKQKDGAHRCSSLDDGRSALDCFSTFNQSIHDPKQPSIHVVQSQRRSAKPRKNSDPREPGPSPCPRAAEHPYVARSGFSTTWNDSKIATPAGYDREGVKAGS